MTNKGRFDGRDIATIRAIYQSSKYKARYDPTRVTQYDLAHVFQVSQGHMNKIVHNERYTDQMSEMSVFVCDNDACGTMQPKPEKADRALGWITVIYYDDNGGDSTMTHFCSRLCFEKGVKAGVLYNDDDRD